MQTHLASWIKDTSDGKVANAILRACVHCGFCTATCPTYQILGDELDGPRGRIYQIKQLLEGAPPSRATQIHLDRCLTCRACETTCPSGVQYGRLVDIGRQVVEQRVARPWRERFYRWLLRESLTRRWIFASALRVGRSLSRALPESLRRKVGTTRAAGVWPKRAQQRKVLLLNGCVQPAMCPSIDAATARVLDAIGVECLIEPRSGCCGAIRHHLNDHRGASDEIRRNIDAWWPYVAAGTVEALVMNASGCSAMVREYAHILRDDAEYAEKARRIVSLVRDLAEFLVPEQARLPRPGAASSGRIAFQSPCTLQHGAGIRGEVERILVGLGAELVPVADAHLCCGSAGTYSLLQPELSRTLRDRKLDCLLQAGPQEILTANIGCLAQLQSGTDVPVRHWIEWVDDRIRLRGANTTNR